MIETDTLSLVFIACFVFASAFILATTLLGATHIHGLHLGSVDHVDISGHMGGNAGDLDWGGADAGGDAGGDFGGHANGGTGHPLRVGLPGAVPAGAASHSLVGRLVGGINLNAILGFLFAFGLLGYLLHNVSHAGSVFTILFAIVFGVGGATALNTIMIRLFGAESGRLGSDSSTMEGRVATVSLPIRTGGVGEVIFMGENGTRRSLGARSIDASAIPRDADVVILGYKNGIAEVQTWDRFIASTRADLDAIAPPGQ
ncbi:MAG: hypothetical protein H0X24_08335 [Ktedonobacterales bacterium]|nr:hypothetical protein [Ktedonobacterales bacterium]